MYTPSLLQTSPQGKSAWWMVGNKDDRSFAYDGLGSVRQLVDAGGSVGLAQTFDPYGNGYASAGSAASSLGFTGEQTDSNGFVFLRARYYNPSMGRFFQIDPSRLEENPYLYSMANPILHTDPSGLLACEGSESCNPAWSSDGASSGGTITIKFDIDPDMLLGLLFGCQEGRDFMIGLLTQFTWDMTAPYRIVPEVSIIMDFAWMLTALSTGSPVRTMEADMDETYRTGSQAYRTGRDAGRAVSTIVAQIETAVGIAGLIAGPGVAIFGGGGIMISCPAIATVIGTIPGVIGCVASGGAVTVGVAVTAAGAVFAAHGAMVLSYIGDGPPGGTRGITSPSPGQLPPQPVYRGGASLKPRPSDIRVDPNTGLLRTDRGISLNADPSKVEGFGGAYQITSIPDELVIRPWGKPGHYEITPAYPMSLEEYTSLLEKVTLAPHP